MVVLHVYVYVNVVGYVFTFTVGYFTRYVYLFYWRWLLVDCCYVAVVVVVVFIVTFVIWLRLHTLLRLLLRLLLFVLQFCCYICYLHTLRCYVVITVLLRLLLHDFGITFARCYCTLWLFMLCLFVYTFTFGCYVDFVRYYWLFITCLLRLRLHYAPRLRSVDLRYYYCYVVPTLIWFTLRLLFWLLPLLRAVTLLRLRLRCCYVGYVDTLRWLFYCLRLPCCCYYIVVYIVWIVVVIVVAGYVVYCHTLHC